MKISIKKLILSSIVILNCSYGMAQIYNFPEGKDFQEKQVFREEFISSNRIKEISCTIEKKKDGDRIRKAFRSEIYRYYESGVLESIHHIDHKRKDTSFTHYSYAADRISCEIKNDISGLFSYCYVYEDGLPVRVDYARSKNLTSLTASVDPDLKKNVSSERVEHVKYDNQLHSKFFNSAGRPYAKEIRYFDENGYYTKFLRTYIMTSNRVEENYRYNEKGFLAQKISKSNTSVSTTTYEYDEIGNLLAENYFENDLLIHRIENVLVPESMLLKAQLKRVENDAYIIIKTFEYSYY